MDIITFQATDVLSSLGGARLVFKTQRLPAVERELYRMKSTFLSLEKMYSH
jgi:hypothetical protein